MNSEAEHSVGALSSALRLQPLRSAPLLELGFWLILAAVWFGIGLDRTLVGPDEGRYAEIAREMLASGQWLVPHLNGVIYLEKPPLQAWLTALAFQLMGPSEVAARSWPALAGFLALVFSAWLARQWGASRLQALLAAGFTASALWWNLMSQFLSLDMGLALWVWVCLGCLHLAQERSEQQAPNRALVFSAWLAAGLGFLSKGLIALVIPGLWVLLLLLLLAWRGQLNRQRWRQLLSTWLSVPGILAFALLVLPWLLLVERQVPGFLQFFLIHEHLTRYLSTGHQREEPLWFFPSLWVIGLWPWTLLWLAALWHSCRQNLSAHMLALAWLGPVVVVFFSLSSSKLPSYLLPAYPSALWLIAHHYPQFKASKQLSLLLLALSLVAGWLLAPKIGVFSDALAPVELFSGWAKALQQAALLALAGLALCVFARSRWVGMLVLMLCLSTAIRWGAQGYESLSPSASAKTLAHSLKPHLKEHSQLYSVGTYEQTLPFYLGRTMQLVNYVDEFRFGQSLNSQHWLSEEAFIQRWQHHSDAYALLPLEGFARMEQQLPHRVIARHPKYIVIGHKR